MIDRIRDLTFEERATWGDCPVCGAPDGKPCRPEIGLPLGVNVHGDRPSEGAHLRRLQATPFRVREVPA